MCENEPQTIPPVKIDFYIANSKEEIFFDEETLEKSLWNRTEEITIFDHKIRYLSLPDLLKLKLRIKTKKTKLPRDRDIEDIYSLIGVAEHKKYRAEHILGFLNNDERCALSTLLEKYIEQYPSRDEIIDETESLWPSKTYATALLKTTKQNIYKDEKQ